MADTPETPKAPTPPRTTTRRRAPRKAGVTAKPAAAKAASATATKRPAAPRKSAATKSAANGSGKVAAAKEQLSKAADRVTKASEKVGGKWGSAALAGGLAVVGAAATAALLSLRGSTPGKSGARGKSPPKKD